MAGTFDEVFSAKAEAKPDAPAVEKVEVAPEPEKVEAKPEGEPKPDKPRDEQGKFKAKEEGEEVPAPPAAKPSKEAKPDDPETGLKAGITAERKKRQEAERERDELRRQFQATQQPPKKTPDVLEDPDGFRRHIETGVQAQLENQRVDMSADMARQVHADFDEVLAEWGPLMQANPALYEQALKARMPAEWAYQYVKRERFMREVGDNPEEWRKAEREKLRAELEPELKKSLESSRPLQPVPPPSLASASSGGRVSSDPAYEPKPFAQLFRR